MDYAVTATQKSILKAFDLAETNIRKQAAGINEDLKCVLSIENPQNRKENSPLSDREIPIIRKKHVESFRFFPYLVGKKAAFTAFCPIG